VLFKPSTAVQAREMNQLQAILQNQIERFGTNILKEGTIVKGGNFVEKRRLPYVKLLDAAVNALNQDINTDVASYVGMKAVGVTTGMEAIVVVSSAGLESQVPDLNTIYVRYINNKLNANNENINTFSETEQLNIMQKDENGVYQLYHTVTVAGAASPTGYANPIGNGYGVRCGDGVIFQKGHFIAFADALTVVSKYNTAPDGVVVGFKTVESIVTSDQDETLLDNAEGFNNFNAPGADRLVLTPVLTVMSTDQAILDETFFALQEYVDGKVVRRRLTTQFNSIEKMVEQRTSEESGDYVVQQFPVSVEQSSSNTANLSVVIGAGVAYVQGKRIELLNDITIDTPESSEYSTAFSQTVAINYGNYITANTFSGAYPVSTLGTVSLVNSTGNTTIGSARVRHVAKDSTNYKIYLFDVTMNSGQSFENVRFVQTGTANNSTAVLTSGHPTIANASRKGLVFPLGRENVKSFTANTTIVYQKQDILNATTGGEIAIIAGTNETFPYAPGSLTANQRDDVIVVLANGQYKAVTSAVVDATSTVITAQIGTLTGPTSTTVYTHANIPISTNTITRKSLETVYVKIQATNVNGPWNLGFPDVYSLEGVWKDTTSAVSEASLNVTSSFTFSNGQTDSYYGHGKLKIKNSSAIALNDWLYVKLKVFKRSAGVNAIFTVDSYPVDDVSLTLPSTKIRTENIPTYSAEKGVRLNLRDVLDLRPHVDATASYTTVTSNPASTITFSDVKLGTPNDLVITQYDYYLARKDIVVANDSGDIQVIQGVSAEAPTQPIAPARSMLLATVSIPPFPSLPGRVANKAGKYGQGVNVSMSDNRRYTMKDVSGIDKRLKNIEYYTSLSLLEKNAADMIVTDASTGLNRFKNGILVDSFDNLMVADIHTTPFSAAIDPTYSEIHPRFRAYPLALKVQDSTNTNNYEDVVTLDRDSTRVLINQPYATDLKSCTTSFYAYNGAIQLIPDNDSAPEYTIAPDVTIDIDLATPFAEYTEELANFIPALRPKPRRKGNKIETKTLVIEPNVVTQDLGDFVTDVQFKPYMRTKEIQVLITGLRPNTRFYFFFDGKDVNKHMAEGRLVVGQGIARTSGFNENNVITSNSNGQLYAIFRLPAETFFVGDRIFEVMDVPLYSSKDAASSTASRVYNAFNFNVTKTGLAASTRQATFDTETTTRTITPTPRGGSDPIAQTFAIDKNLSSDDSVMLTSVDVYFAKKSTVGNGVGLQIREVVNGYPSGIAVPFSSVHLDAADVNANNTVSTNLTRFTFPAPVAIKTDTEYAIVIAPDANDPDYFVWIAKTGGVDVDQNIAITEDTNAGVLFTSTNNKVWTPYQDQNLKFKLRAARYTVSSGTVTLTPKNPEFFTVTSMSGSFVGDEKIVLKNKANAGGTVSLVKGNTTVSGTGTTFDSTFNVGQVMVVADTGAGTYQALQISAIASNTSMTVTDIPTESISVNTYWSSPAGKYSYYDAVDPAILILEESTATSALKFTANTTSNTVLVGVQSGAEALVTEVKDLAISYVQTVIPRSSFNTTRDAITASKVCSIVDDVSSSYSVKFDFNDNNYLTRTPSYIKSRSNDISRLTPFEMTITLRNVSPTTKDVSPMIDHASANITAYEYLVNDISTNETGDFGDTKSKYVSRKVELADGLDAIDVRTFLTAYRPPNTDIIVYIKFQSASDPRRFDEVEWTELDVKTETNVYSSRGDRDDFREFEFGLGTTVKTAGQGAWLNGNTIRYIDPTGAVYNDYKYFAVKIGMLSEGHNVVPRIADMRTLALS
jgi:hypothetical protein